jgi:hypothetical protein
MEMIKNWYDLDINSKKDVYNEISDRTGLVADAIEKD